MRDIMAFSDAAWACSFGAVPERVDKRCLLVLVTVLVGIALMLRLYGIDARSMTHPEVFVPGIDLIAGHSTPPPRHSIWAVLRMHFHDEPHPVGWYTAMFFWAKLFGTTEFALRLPSAIIGAASVPLIFLLGRRVYGPVVGLTVAALLTLHGFHIFWSQNARMYAMGGFLSILATLLLLRLTYDKDAGRGTAIGYVLTLIAGTSTVELFWPLIGTHILWAFLMLPADGPFRWRDLVRGRFEGAHRVVQLQSVALMLSAPELLHGVYRARAGAAADPSLGWLREYLSFGFLFEPDSNLIDPLRIGAFATLALLALAFVLLGAAALVRRQAVEPAAQTSDVPIALARAIAVVSTAFMVWLASIAHQRTLPLLLVATGPLLSLTLPSLSRAANSAVSWSEPLDRWRRKANGQVVLIWFLAILAPLIILLASHAMSLLASRAFLVLVPYLLLLLSAPLSLLEGRPVARGAVLALLLVVVMSSIPYSWKKPGSPRDYKTLVTEMKPLMQDSDLVFILDLRWEEAPFIYYLPKAHYVFSNYAEAMLRSPSARIWLVTWPSPYEPVINDERRVALARYRPAEHLTALRASAELFLPSEGAGSD
jgi:hypothetical protein